MRDLSQQLDLLREERQTIRGRVSQMLELMAGLEEGGGEARREH